ncbi:MAG: Smr/MutS family protein [Mollicutes bacterium]|jgi:DNA-nicking Smr family endonuclease|nr:Smr/MutS family protein [Mollicutes bacterium]
MARLDEVIFVDNLPKLDLHGLDRNAARMYINDFIKDNIIMKNEFVLIVYGNGEGVLREVTHKCLSQNNHVIDHKILYYNSGCTLVQLKIE